MTPDPKPTRAEMRAEHEEAARAWLDSQFKTRGRESWENMRPALLSRLAQLLADWEARGIEKGWVVCGCGDVLQTEHDPKCHNCWMNAEDSAELRGEAKGRREALELMVKAVSVPLYDMATPQERAYATRRAKDACDLLLAAEVKRG